VALLRSRRADRRADRSFGGLTKEHRPHHRSSSRERPETERRARTGAYRLLEASGASFCGAFMWGSQALHSLTPLHFSGAESFIHTSGLNRYFPQVRFLRMLSGANRA
jgi:hypothetical protein